MGKKRRRMGKARRQLSLFVSSSSFIFLFDKEERKRKE
jgi:hypothetical protein